MSSSYSASLFAAGLVLLCASLVPACGGPAEPAAASTDPAKQPPRPGQPLPTDAELRQRLTPLQYSVARESSTERPFTNEYWKTHEEGIYVDIVSGKPLFSSKDKFDSECGWPAFAKPIDEKEIKKLADHTWGERVEVRSASGDTHLGHIFDDGPAALGGKRYCINSASIRFIPKAKLAEAGYGDYLRLFEPKK